jgi:RNA polymerase sigma factor (sigma-70 family)
VSFLKNTTGDSLPDIELLARFQRTGDLQWLGQLYQRYMDLVFGVCLKYFKEEERSRDAVMQIFEQLAVKLRKHDVENFKSWLYQLAKNHCLMELRTPRNLRFVELSEGVMQSREELHLNGVMEREENLERLTVCLETLSDEQRQAVRLFYLEQKCYNEIVELMGKEWNQVRSFIQNGRRNLKICIENKSASTQPVKS